MVDPSIVLSDPWLSWMEEDRDDEAIAEVVVSRALVNSLRERRARAFYPWLREEHQADYGSYRERAISLVEKRRVEQFTYDGTDLADDVREVLVALLETGDDDAQVLADEWAFLVSQSWMLSATRTSVEAFRRHGAWIVQFGRRWTLAMAEEVIKKENIPPRFTPGFLVLLGAKYAVWGGAVGVAGAGGFVGGTAVLGPVGGAGGGAALGLFAEVGTKKALLEFDP